MPDYEYRPVYFPPGTDRDTASNTLVIHAMYGEWELDRVRLWPDGRRKVVLRRHKRRGSSPPLPS